jgi:hypothetical protein
MVENMLERLKAWSTKKLAIETLRVDVDMDVEKIDLPACSTRELCRRCEDSILVAHYRTNSCSFCFALHHTLLCATLKHARDAGVYIRVHSYVI